MLVRDVAAAWWAWMAPLALQVALLGAAVLLLDAWLARRAWPQVRLLLWASVLAKALVPPGLASPLALRAPWAWPLAGADVGGEVPGWLFAALAVWLAGVACCLLLAGVRARAARRARSAACPAPLRVAGVARRAAATLGLRRAPLVLTSPEAAGPHVAGLLRPVVVLSPADQARPARELWHVLLHELAHVRRRDPWLAAAAAGVRALLWFHPLAWLAARRVAQLLELCCDAAVADRLQDHTAGYRATLLAEAGRRLLPAPAWRGAPATVLQRLEALRRPVWRWRGARRATVATLAALLLACVLPAGRTPSLHAVPDSVLASARATLRAALAGERPGCLATHNALLVAAAAGGLSPSPSRSDP